MSSINLKRIRESLDNTKIYIITDGIELYKENGKYIFFDNEKEAFDYTLNKDLKYMTMYLSRYRV